MDVTICCVYRRISEPRLPKEADPFFDASAVSTSDYFLRSAPIVSGGKVFGDTLLLNNSTPTTNPRFSQVTIVYGRGIVSLNDDVEDCVWSR